jgi:endonuclease/exonuclease/phosphatase family metal-dependent hydrolase
MKRVIVGTAALAMSILAMPVVTAALAYAANNYTIGQFNMAGGHDKHGKLGDEAPDALVRSVKDRKPAWLTLQESCADWNNRMKSELSEYDIIFHAVRARTGGPVAKCKHDTDFGNSILFRKDFGFEPAGQKQHPLGSPSDKEQREMLCMKAPAKKVAVCTIHLTHNNDKARDGEAAKAQEILAGQEYAGYRIFLGGDLNGAPASSMANNFYHRDYGYGAHGRYKEVDSPCGNKPSGKLGCRSGHPTLGGSKIDYIFVSPSVNIVRAEIGNAHHSDHRLLWSVVSF